MNSSARKYFKLVNIQSHSPTKLIPLCQWASSRNTAWRWPHDPCLVHYSSECPGLLPHLSSDKIPTVATDRYLYNHVLLLSGAILFSSKIFLCTLREVKEEELGDTLDSNRWIQIHKINLPQRQRLLWYCVIEWLICWFLGVFVFNPPCLYAKRSPYDYTSIPYSTIPLSLPNY